MGMLSDTKNCIHVCRWCKSLNDRVKMRCAFKAYFLSFTLAGNIHLNELNSVLGYDRSWRVTLWGRGERNLYEILAASGQFCSPRPLPTLKRSSQRPGEEPTNILSKILDCDGVTHITNGAEMMWPVRWTYQNGTESNERLSVVSTLFPWNSVKRNWKRFISNGTGTRCIRFRD